MSSADDTTCCASIAGEDDDEKGDDSSAAALKLTCLIFNSGASWRVPEGFPAEEAFGQLAAFGRQLAAAASQHGIYGRYDE